MSKLDNERNTELLIQYQNGNHENENELFKNIRTYIENLIYLNNYYFHSNVEYEDFIQNVCVKIIENIKKYNSELSKCFTWVSTLCKFEYLNNRKKANKEYNRETPLFYDDSEGNEANALENAKSGVKAYASAEREYFHNKAMSVIEETVPKLSKKNWLAYKLVLEHNLKPSEAAKLTNEKAENISNRVNRAKNIIKEALEKEGLQDDLQPLDYYRVA